MKTLIILFFSLIMTKSCNDKKNEMAQNETGIPVETVSVKDKSQVNTKVEYEAMTRGYFEKIKFENNQIIVAKDRNDPNNVTTISLSKEEVTELNNLLKAFNPEELPELQWPTEKRFYDGAAHANLTITVNEQVYRGKGFDAGDPPAKIKKIVDTIIAFSNKN